MTLDEALAYLTPHPLTRDGGTVLLTAHKMRAAIAVIRAALGDTTDAATPRPVTRAPEATP